MVTSKIILTYYTHNKHFCNTCQGNHLNKTHTSLFRKKSIRLQTDKKAHTKFKQRPFVTIENKVPYKYHILNKIWESREKSVNFRISNHALIFLTVAKLLILNKIFEPLKQAYGSPYKALQIKKLSSVLDLKNWLGSNKAVEVWSMV